MKFKKVCTMAVAAMAALSMVACSSAPTETAPAETPAETPAAEETTEETAEPVETTTLEIAFNQDESHPQYIALAAFGETLKEKTNGAYEVEIYPSELLGAQKETLEMVQSGTIAMTVVANSLLENWNPDFSVFNLPYLFYSVEHQQAVVNDAAVVGELYSSIEDNGMKVMAAFHGGVRNIYNSAKPIETPADLAGMKIRVLQSDTNIEMMNLLGGVGVAMGQGEVYTAIQTGVLDGAENNELIFDSLLQYEVAPYYSYTKHLMMPDMLVMSTDIWNTLPADVQQIFIDEMPAAVDMEYASFAESVEAALASANEKGAQINEPDIAPFMAAVAPLTESKITTDVTKAIYDHIKATEADFK